MGLAPPWAGGGREGAGNAGEGRLWHGSWDSRVGGRGAPMGKGGPLVGGPKEAFIGLGEFSPGCGGGFGTGVRWGGLECGSLVCGTIT